MNINLCLTFIWLYRFVIISIRLDAPFINREVNCSSGQIVAFLGFLKVDISSTTVKEISLSVVIVNFKIGLQMFISFCTVETALKV